MSHHFIDTINPWRCVNERQSFNKVVDANRFERLVAATHAFTEPVSFFLEASRDIQNHAVISGHIKANVDLICERCLLAFTLPLYVDFKWLPVKSEKEVETLGELDAVIIIEEDTFNLLEALEDELLLALPMIANHTDVEKCKGREFLSIYPKIEKKNPFAVLQDLQIKD